MPDSIKETDNTSKSDAKTLRSAPDHGERSAERMGGQSATMRTSWTLGRV
jgi:hypothetical protein